MQWEMFKSWARPWISNYLIAFDYAAVNPGSARITAGLAAILSLL
jgi:hypothetical protein